MKVVNAPARIVTTERWFIYRGLPHAISGYSATDDVLTRMAPFLGLVFLLELFTTFGDRFAGWAQAGVFFAGVAIVVGVVGFANRVRRRPFFALPDDVETMEILLFLVVPAGLLRLFGDGGWWAVLVLVVTNLVILALGFFVTSFGLVPMFRWGLGHVRNQLRQLAQLLARGLPLLLLFSTFLFLNAEMWQVAHDFTPVYYCIVIGLMLSAAIGFLALRMPRERDALTQFGTWREICHLAEFSDAPYGADQDPGLPDPPKIEPLERPDRLNVVLMLMASQLVQMILVALAMGLFYIVFGLFAVRGDTLLQWTTITAESFDPIFTLDIFGSQVVMTWELLAVAGFVAAFSALQFAVSALTDQTYREEFFTGVEGEIREVLAVRALYLEEIANLN